MRDKLLCLLSPPPQRLNCEGLLRASTVDKRGDGGRASPRRRIRCKAACGATLLGNLAKKHPRTPLPSLSRAFCSRNCRCGGLYTCGLDRRHWRLTLQTRNGVLTPALYERPQGGHPRRCSRTRRGVTAVAATVAARCCSERIPHAGQLTLVMTSDVVTIILTLEGEKVRPRCEVHHPVITNHWPGLESLSVCTVRAHVLSPSGHATPPLITRDPARTASGPIPGMAGKSHGPTRGHETSSLRCLS